MIKLSSILIEIIFQNPQKVRGKGKERKMKSKEMDVKETGVSTWLAHEFSAGFLRYFKREVQYY